MTTKPPRFHPARRACCVCSKPAEPHAEVCRECKRVIR